VSHPELEAGSGWALDGLDHVGGEEGADESVVRALQHFLEVVGEGVLVLVKEGVHRVGYLVRMTNRMSDGKPGRGRRAGRGRESETPPPLRSAPWIKHLTALWGPLT